MSLRLTDKARAQINLSQTEKTRGSSTSPVRQFLCQTMPLILFSWLVIRLSAFHQWLSCRLGCLSSWIGHKVDSEWGPGMCRRCHQPHCSRPSNFRFWFQQGKLIKSLRFNIAKAEAWLDGKFIVRYNAAGTHIADRPFHGV